LTTTETTLSGVLEGPAVPMTTHEEGSHVPAEVDAGHMAVPMELSFIDSPLRKICDLDVVELLGRWDASESVGAKRLRLSSSLSLSARYLRHSTGTRDMSLFLSALGKNGTRDSAPTNQSSSTEVTNEPLVPFSDDMLTNDLDDLREDDQAMTALVSKVDDMSQDFRRITHGRGLPGAPPPSISISLDLPCSADLQDQKNSLEEIRKHFHEKFATEFHVQVRASGYHRSLHACQRGEPRARASGCER
jgi:hypothetical protein